MITETITWTSVDARTPVDDLTVLVDVVDSAEPVWLGWYDGEEWHDTSDGSVVNVHAWAHVPKGLRALQAELSALQTEARS